MTITAAAGERQSLRGVGAGQNIDSHEGFDRLTARRQEMVQDHLWTDLDLNALRLWLPLELYAPTPGVRDLDAAYVRPYAAMVRGALARGVNQIIVTGDGAPDWMRETRTVTDEAGRSVEKVVLRRDMVDTHAAALAEYAAALRDDHGLTVDAITLQNEPDSAHGDFRLFYNAPLMVEGVKALRSALDARGLQRVAIVGPETANADDTAVSMLQALKDDPDAWDALGGIATHSYNMAATEETAAFTDGFTKPYWQTESSSVGPEDPGDVERGASLAARFLNDMNHGVTHWFYFIGYDQTDPADNGTRLIKYDPDDPTDGWITVHTKADYLDQLTDAFDIGATFRGVDSSLEGGMTWSYGRKPRVVASVARNPDGTWAVAVVNYTSDDFATGTAFERDNAGHAAEAFGVTLVIEELRDAGAVEMDLRLSGPVAGGIVGNADRGRATVLDGRVTITVEPLQLVTLRSVRAVPR